MSIPFNTTRFVVQPLTPKKESPKKKTYKKTVVDKTVKRKESLPEKKKTQSSPKEAVRVKKGPSVSRPGKSIKKRDGQKSASMEDRLEYYKKKYGEDFKVSGQKSSGVSKTPLNKDKKPIKKAKLIKRLMSMFKK